MEVAIAGFTIIGFIAGFLVGVVLTLLCQAKSIRELNQRVHDAEADALLASFYTGKERVGLR